VTFGAVAEDAAKLTPPASVELKDPDTWKIAGNPRRRLDVLDKVTAQPIYAIDVGSIRFRLKCRSKAPLSSL
jgi:isoquinoline 1-oxidoreductase beta subunit